MFSPPLRRINFAKQISEDIDLALRNFNKIKIGVSCVAYLLRLRIAPRNDDFSSYSTPF